MEQLNFNDFDYFKKGIASVSKNGKYGVINEKGLSLH